jgi:hypothetical protein
MSRKQVSSVFRNVDELTGRFIVRDFTFEDSALEKQRKELSELEAEEKELWVSYTRWVLDQLS